MIKACFLDLDNTVIDDQGQLYDGLEPALDGSRRDIVSTFLTARGYTRFLEAMANNPALAATPGLPIALENGGRIIDSTATRNLSYTALSGDEQDAICGVIEKQQGLRFVAFHAKELRTKTVIWSPSPVEADRLRTAYSDNADVFSGPDTDLFQKIRESQPCMITCQTYDDIAPDVPDGIEYSGRGCTVNFMAQGIDKGVAAHTIAEMANLAMSNILAAGNDRNDFPVLNIVDLGLPVLVGTDLEKSAITDELPARTVYLLSQRLLGNLILGVTSIL